MAQYEGRRTPEGCQVFRQDGASVEELSLRLDLWNHSPNGFEWGYGGSGPAQLALALLADALRDDERAVEIHQKFKWKVVGRLPEEEWTLTEEEIREMAASLGKNEEAL